MSIMKLSEMFNPSPKKRMRHKRSIISVTTEREEYCESCDKIQSLTGNRNAQGRAILAQGLLDMQHLLASLHNFAKFTKRGEPVWDSQQEYLSKLREDLILRVRNYKNLLRHTDYYITRVTSEDRGMFYSVLSGRFEYCFLTSSSPATRPNKVVSKLVTFSENPLNRWTNLLKTKRSMLKQNRQARKTVGLYARAVRLGPFNRTSGVNIGPAVSLHFVGNNKIGYVFDKPETILNLMYTRKAKIIFDPKLPKTNKRHVGIELEFTCAATDKMLAAEFGKINLQGKMQLKADGSIRTDVKDHHAHELCILATEDEYASIVEQVCIVLSKFKAKVNKSCGMHVHLDMRDRDKETCFSNLVTAQPLLYAMNPPSRAVNKFCKKSTKKQFGVNVERYFGINAQAYHKYQTIEIRIHSGTILAEKINNWVKVLLCIVNKQDKILRAPRKFTTFCKHFDFDMALTEYVAGRIEKFIGADLEMEEAA